MNCLNSTRSVRVLLRVGVYLCYVYTYIIDDKHSYGATARGYNTT